MEHINFISAFQKQIFSSLLASVGFLQERNERAERSKHYISHKEFISEFRTVHLSYPRCVGKTTSITQLIPILDKSNVNWILITPNRSMYRELRRTHPQIPESRLFTPSRLLEIVHTLYLGIDRPVDIILFDEVSLKDRTSVIEELEDYIYIDDNNIGILSIGTDK